MAGGMQFLTKKTVSVTLALYLIDYQYWFESSWATKASCGSEGLFPLVAVMRSFQERTKARSRRRSARR